MNSSFKCLYKVYKERRKCSFTEDPCYPYRQGASWEPSCPTGNCFPEPVLLFHVANGLILMEGWRLKGYMPCHFRCLSPSLRFPPAGTQRRAPGQPCRQIFGALSTHGRSQGPGKPRLRFQATECGGGCYSPHPLRQGLKEPSERSSHRRSEV